MQTRVKGFALSCSLLLLAVCWPPPGANATRLAASGANEKQTAPKAKGQKPWAFQSPVRPALPTVEKMAWIRNPIDAFVLAKLGSKGLSPAPQADRPTLIRRVSFDLIGLPPTPEEVLAFVGDDKPQAYERLVERLLNSPRYGERWAMYWLDLVRFAESDGFKADDVRPNAWRYRDYVIRAFNTDKPYDRFLREQVAGDELYPGDPDALIATAFNRHFPDEFNARNLEQRRQEILNDMTDTTGLVFLGLTVGCARCHDHKYDPISQKDYYRLQAFFAAVSPRDEMPLGRSHEIAAHDQKIKAWESKTAALRAQMDTLEQPVRQKLVERDKSKFARYLQEAYDTPPERRTPFQQQIAELLAKQLDVKRAEMTKAMKPDVRTEWQKLDKQMAQFNHLRPAPLPSAMGVTDIGPIAPPTHLLKRGNWRHKGEVVGPGFLEILDPKNAVIPAPSGLKTTGRRAALAEWLTQPDHPLTARVMVNRLWQHHFGRGVVGTTNDFGEQGEKPTHPELLDWLAREFVQGGWRLKALHRLMVTSATYRQSSRFDAEAAKVDGDNRRLWRMNRKRLEGEALRDAMLAVSGQLNLKMGGPSIFPELPAEMNVPRGGWPVSADVSERHRRSVYVFLKRNLRYPLFDAFDAPDSNEPCARRHLSTNAPQALMMFNGKITLDLARAFAGRVLREAPSDSKAIIDRAYRLALGRPPDTAEVRLASDFLERETSILRTRLANKQPVALPSPAPAQIDAALGGAVVDFCQVLLNVNEFLYVD